MIDTYLVQRLRQPPESEKHGMAERAFGGAMLALSDDAWKLLHHCFSFDYMGAAEFEFGTIPKALKALAKDKLRAFEMVVDAKFIEPNWARGRTARTKAGKPRKKQPVHPPVADRTVYVLCREEHVGGAKEAIQKLAGGKVRTKCGSGFACAMDPIEERDGDVCGWLELDNGYFFFLDKWVWRRTATLFMGVDPAPTSANPNPPPAFDPMAPGR